MTNSMPASELPAVTLKLEHQDTRGVILQIGMPGDHELLLFFCRAGYLRGGHSHDVPEMVVLLSGRMKYHKHTEQGYTVLELRGGDVSYNQPGEAHMGEFLEDTWLVEWKLGPNSAIGKWTTTDFEPFRKQVRERMA